MQVFVNQTCAHTTSAHSISMIKTSIRKLIRVAAVALLGMGIAYGLTPVIMNLSAQASETKTKKKAPFVATELPSNVSAPGNRTEHGSRGDDGELLPLEQQVVAIVPQFEHMGDNFLMSVQVWVLSTSSRPTFWFHVPASKGMALRFVIERPIPPTQGSGNQNDYQVVYEQEIQTSTAGFLPITLPQSFTGLQQDQQYRWSLEFQSLTPMSATPKWQRVQGWAEVQPLSDDLARQLETASPEDAVAIYGQSGIWLDSFAAMTELYQADSERYRTQWEQFLEVIELEALSDKPILRGGSFKCLSGNPAEEGIPRFSNAPESC